MEIAIDFDGTCVTHAFPQVGKDIGAVPVLKELVANGHRLILYTMRSDRAEKNPTGHSDIEDVTGNFLTDAINWFESNGIPLYAIQQNPSQSQWTTSNKCYAHLYIDDAALGCPLEWPDGADRPFVDWASVRTILMDTVVIKGITNNDQ